jgi:Flp pilus assembly protein TadG
MAALSLRRFLRAEAGAELLEFALAMPILLVVLAAIVDMGFLFRDYEVVTNAAREGARMASLPGWTESDVRARVNRYLAAGGFQGTATTTVSDVVIADANGRSIGGVKVVVDAPHDYWILGPIVKLVQSADLPMTTLRGASTMRSEVAAGL